MPHPGARENRTGVKQRESTPANNISKLIKWPRCFIDIVSLNICDGCIRSLQVTAFHKRRKWVSRKFLCPLRAIERTLTGYGLRWSEKLRVCNQALYSLTFGHEINTFFFFKDLFIFREKVSGGRGRGRRRKRILSKFPAEHGSQHGPRSHHQIRTWVKTKR